jgi:hypothetical protein
LGLIRTGGSCGVWHLYIPQRLPGRLAKREVPSLDTLFFASLPLSGWGKVILQCRCATADPRMSLGEKGI